MKHPPYNLKASDNQFIMTNYILGKMPARTVAAILSLPMQTIYAQAKFIRQSHNFEPRRKPAAIDWKLVGELKNEGSTAWEIANFLGTPESTIKYKDPGKGASIRKIRYKSCS